MTDAISMARLSMLGDLERLRISSQNIANIGTAAYRRQVAVSGDFSALVGRTSGVSDTSEAILTSATDNRSGTLRATARPLDIALEGEGFFRVSTDQGPRYSRRGDLELDSQRRLVTVSGDPVLGTAGEIRLSSDQVTINSLGEIHSGQELLGKLDVVEFENPQALAYEGKGLFRADESTPFNAKSKTRVRQGFLEDSNVNPLNEMLQLMQTSRHFELTRNAVTAYDEMLDSAINTLGQL